MLAARSVEEVHLYLDLRRCGHTGATPGHHLDDRDGILVSVYEVRCPDCGIRSFEFTLPERPLQAGEVGGLVPSTIIDPGEFLWLSDRAAAAVPVDLAQLPSEARPGVVAALRRASSTLAEVLKFIPAGSDEVPREAFTSTLGQRLTRDMPERFRRDELEERLAAYRHHLSTYPG